jgi:hypothetical protein
MGELEEFHPVHGTHPDVGDHEVELFGGRDEIFRFVAAQRGYDNIALSLEKRGEHAENAWLIVNQKYSCHGLSPKKTLRRGVYTPEKTV